MNTVITLAQAKQITGGRNPHMPVEYENAVNALQACITLDEAKLWSDKADALAAWAKIYRSDDAARKAQQLKLHAYRRMGELALDLRPQQRKRRSDGKIMGKKDGPASLLREQGLSSGKEFAATKLARLPQDEFEKLIARDRPPSPMAALRATHGSMELNQVVASANSFRAACRNISPDNAARLLARAITPAQQSLFRELADWLDRLDQSLKCSSVTVGASHET
jgi:hypothetical protein